jgi:hypothetical protein
MYFLFYDVHVNFSANLLHRFMKLYDGLYSRKYARPYSSLNRQSIPANSFSTSGVSTNGYDMPSESTSTNLEDKKDFENLARKLEKHVLLSKYNFVFKKPLILLHPYSHLIVTPQVSYFNNRIALINFIIVDN